MKLKTEKQHEKINETKSQFSEKSGEIDIFPARLTKKKQKQYQE